MNRRVDPREAERAASPLRELSIPAAIRLPHSTPETRGAVPTFSWIEVRLLVVDERYQRSAKSRTSIRNMQDIADNFRWTRFAPLMVAALEDGRFAVIDGRHRATMAMAAGVDKVPCMVTIATLEEQARSFEAVNAKVTAVGAGQIFKAQIAAGDGEAALLDRTAAAAGVKILTYTPHRANMRPNETTALKATRRLLDELGPEGAVAVLSALRKNLTGKRRPLSELNVSALGDLAAEDPAWLSWEGFEDAVAALELDEIGRSARARAALEENGRARVEMLALLRVEMRRARRAD